MQSDMLHSAQRMPWMLEAQRSHSRGEERESRGTSKGTTAAEVRVVEGMRAWVCEEEEKEETAEATSSGAEETTTRMSGCVVVAGAMLAGACSWMSTRPLMLA